MAPSIASIAPALADANGGFVITLSGAFVMGRGYQVYVGADATGAVCYSGVSGQGSLCISPDGQTLRCALPIVPAGDVPLCVLDTSDNSTATVSGLLRAESPFLDAQVFSLRQNMRPTLAVGPTDPSMLPDAAPVPGFSP